jgi:hypothetical protein
MNIEVIEKMLNFFKEKEGHELPEAWFDLLKKLELIKELETHPDGTQYRYEGDLNLDGTNITKLPNDLYVGGHLSLRGCSQLTKLPDKLYVKTILHIVDSIIEELPNDLYVGDNINLMKCKQLQELPNNLRVRGFLDLSDSNLIKLPDNFYVKHTLYLIGTNITEMPKKLYVGRDLFLWDTPINKKYSLEEVDEMITLKGGRIVGKIFI